MWESQGPEGKVRGSAQQIFEKYRQMAQESSDPIRRETYRQWAEHYHRLTQDAKPKKVRRVVRVSAEGEDGGDMPKVDSAVSQSRSDEPTVSPPHKKHKPVVSTPDQATHDSTEG